ncbi:hypothetical protein Q5752_002969 [Cryptotrichosporon argae]
MSHGMLADEHWRAFTSDPADYDIDVAIGFGASSMVHAGVFKLSVSRDGRKAYTGEGRECAIKASTTYPDVEQLSREARLLGLCRHPNVLRVLATFVLPPDHARVAIVTPLIAGGSLAGILDWRARSAAGPAKRHFGRGRQRGVTGVKGLSEDETKAVARQVLDGLAYLHENGFLHRDLKAANLLVDLDGTVLIADFGVGGDLNDAASPATARTAVSVLAFEATGTTSRLGAPGVRPQLGKRQSFVGTPSWMAPEIIAGAEYDAKADIWSLGITLLELAYGALPSAARAAKDIYVETVMGTAPALDRAAGGFSKHMKDFVDGCLQKDAARRPTARALRDHTWLRGAKGADFLADALLGDIPTLASRLEFGLVPAPPTQQSRRSSWDFDASQPPSPVRSVLFPTRSSRDASLSLSLSASPSRALAVPRTLPRDTLSAPSSRLSADLAAPSAAPYLPPPSPRVSLRDWAIATPTTETPTSWLGPSMSGSGSGGLAARGGSDRGRARETLKRGRHASMSVLGPSWETPAGLPSRGAGDAGAARADGMPARTAQLSASPEAMLDALAIEPPDRPGPDARDAVPIIAVPQPPRRTPAHARADSATPTPGSAAVAHIPSQALCEPAPIRPQSPPIAVPVSVAVPAPNPSAPVPEAALSASPTPTLAASPDRDKKHWLARRPSEKGDRARLRASIVDTLTGRKHKDKR